MKVKPFRVSQQQLRSTLARLGKTSDAVFTSLLRQRCYGGAASNNCPVAVFLRRTFKLTPARVRREDIDVDVGVQYITLNGATLRPTPEPIKKFIEAFDGRTEREGDEKYMRLYSSKVEKALA